MVRQLALVTFVVAALVLLILYSQVRTSHPFVSGIIETDEIRLGSRVGGRVKHVLVDEGDRVTAGIPLIEFEPFDLLERERQAIAELAVAEAETRRLRSGLRTEEIGQAKARVDQLTAQLKLLELGPRTEEIDAGRERLNVANAELLFARREYKRRKTLVESNAISVGELDAARERFDAAQANVEVRKNELAILEAGARDAELEQARAKVDEARLAWDLAVNGFRSEEIEKAQAAQDAAAAALEVIRQQKKELTIHAPADGFVDALDLQAGDLVGPNAPVMTILSDQHMWVRAYVPQRFLQLAVGQRLQVTVDSFPNENFVGEISFISQQAEFTPSNVQTVDDRAKQVYRMRVTIDGNDDPSTRLRAGMTANVWLEPVDGGDKP